MNGYFIAEEGPLAGMTIVFEEDQEDKEWLLGRDPETVEVVLEDPMVSRQHAMVRATTEGFVLENLSTVNPATQNGMVIADPILLKEGDIIQIGSTFFHFTEKEPKGLNTQPVKTDEVESNEAPEEGGQMPSELHFGPSPDTRWLLKVISGPNSGAEFAMNKSSTYVIGKDPNSCDIVFQDLSVSKDHARLSIDDEENVFIEDLGSRNGVIVNGELIDEKHLLATQDLVALGTTTFLVIDRVEPRETILSPPTAVPHVTKKAAEISAKAALKEARDWKEVIIPKRHLAMAAVFSGVLFISVFAMFSLFKAEPVIVTQIDESEKIDSVLAKFQSVKFSFNQPSGKLFLTGNVLTTVDHEELTYLLKEIPFISDIEDNVIVDELVWQSMNALISRNSDWVGVSLYSKTPGQFILRGYVPTLEEAEALRDFINLNFDYLSQLDNQIIIEKNLQAEIESFLMERGFSSVAFEISNGEVVFTGRVENKDESSFQSLVGDLKRLPGVRTLKNYVVITTEDTSSVDLSKDYKITGYSRRDEKDFYVVINGRILGQGDLVDGMLITKIRPKRILLQREGSKFRIDYNIQ